MLRNLLAIIDSTSFAIRLQLARTFLIEETQLGHISQFSYYVFQINFDNLLNIKWLIFHKIITSK